MTYIPAGHRVVVRPESLEEVDEVFKAAKAAGIEIAETEQHAREKAAVVFGTLVSIGFQAWKDMCMNTEVQGQPWAKVGDRVMFARYSGTSFQLDGAKHLILNDQDILAVVNEETK